jgi:cytoplasmic iron level regulating protein YaaA (DUF328/UPF0246 family)
MILLLSPSKTLDMETSAPVTKPTQPVLLQESEILVEQARKLSMKKLQALMDISEKLATLNHARFQKFSTPFTKKNAKPGLFAFRGDVYDGLNADSFSADDIEYAQAHLRILSGLYGLLRPCDLMQAYRLEMGISLKNPRGKNLYDFWGERITLEINKAAKAAKSEAILNLASQEYFKAVHAGKLAKPLITVQFKERRGNKLQTIALFAKKARGAMARWVIQERVERIADLSHFAEDGYGFDETLSSHAELVFVR